MEFFTLKLSTLFLMHDPIGVNLLTSFWLKFRHFNEGKFFRKFKCCLGHIYGCSAYTDTAWHIFVCCQFFENER